MRDRSVMLNGLLTSLALVATACTVSVTTDTSPPGGQGDPTGARTVSVSATLAAFDACDEFLDYTISHAVELVGPYGLEGGSGPPWFGPDVVAMEEAAATAGGDDGGAARAFSGTNVQVEGVDEPDMVKTDGRRIVVIAAETLIVVDVTGDEPVETGRLRLDAFATESLFLAGDKVLVFGSVWSSHPVPLPEGDAAFAPVPQSPKVQVLEVDIGGDPEIVRTMAVDGRLVSGRMTGDTVRLVMASSPVGFDWSYPEGSGLRAERKAVEENREIVRQSTPENWIPYYVVTDSNGDVVDEGTLFDCDRARHPEEFSGLDMLSIVTVDLGGGLDVSDATGVLATGNTVYASPDSLYVATQDWQTWQWARSVPEGGRPDDEVITRIHKFDTNGTRAEYVASGDVDGYLLDQFAMDEHDGLLRVASTTSPSWWGSAPDSESMVTVLTEVDGELIRIGLVDGLGLTEQIYSVRFTGDVAYVVTFRQTDPLYTIDLSDPRHPAVTGELKILGYSAYLHPLGDGLLLGVGQDADEEGRVRGTQVSVFDVGDPADPRRVGAYTLSKGSNSDVEYDHHAFLYWEGLAMIPVQQWHWDERSEEEEVFFGAVGLRVGDDGSLSEVSRVVHPGGDTEGEWDWRARIVRSVVIGDSVYTVSEKGIMKSGLGTLDTQAWLGF